MRRILLALTLLAVTALLTVATGGAAHASYESPGARGLDWAEAHALNAPYAWGGSGPWSYDCSGLVMESLGRATGIWLPHNVQDMVTSGKLYRIALSQARRGDFLVWIDSSGYAYHIEYDTVWYHTGFGAETYGWAGRVTWHPWWGTPTAWRLQLPA